MVWLTRIAAAVILVAVVAEVQRWRSSRTEPAAFATQIESVEQWESDTLFENGSVAEVSIRIADPVGNSDVSARRIEDVLLSAEWHPDRFERFEAIADLGDSRDAKAELGLINLLSDPDRDIREAAVESLGSLATQGAIEALRYALTDQDALVRLTAIELLAEIGTPDAVYALAATVDESDLDVRLAAVGELGEIQSAAANSVLQQFLSDSDASLRAIAAEYLDNF